MFEIFLELGVGCILTVAYATEQKMTLATLDIFSLEE